MKSLDIALIETSGVAIKINGTYSMISMSPPESKPKTLAGSEV
jgi:hypothetical protein